MTYDESISWLEATQKWGIKLGLENIRALLAGLGDPQKKFASLHIAGTNGKGSTGAMLDAILRRAGRRCGFFSSPHLVDFCERVRVDGKMISHEEAAAGISRIRSVAETLDLSPTYFEVATALAFLVFAQRECEFAVVETGMGGRLDSTNVIEPLISVITPIDFDHCKWLGDTLPEIAGEKAGIIKVDRPVVSAQQAPEARTVLECVAAECGAPLDFVQESWHGEVGLMGAHQRANAALAALAIHTACPEIAIEYVRDGIAQAEWAGRFQRIGEDIILDGAHNPHGSRALVAAWREQFGEKHTPVIFGCLADKNFHEVLDTVAPIASHFFYVPIANERSLAPETLAKLYPGRVCATLAEGLACARAAKQESWTPILATGSLFLIGEIIEEIK